MSKYKQYLIYGILTSILSMMIFFGQKAYTDAVAFERLTGEMVAMQGLEESTKLQLENFAKSILGDLYEAERQINLTQIIQKQQHAMLEAERYTRYFMYLLVVMLLSFFILSLREYTFFGSLTALTTLVFGLISPLLMITIHKEVEYIGDVVFSFESKGLMGSVSKLFESGDIVVAIVLSLFSVIVPMLKVLSMFFISIFMESKFAHGIVKFFKLIGKWSMLDVFVVAVFLVYLTANKGDISRAKVEVGLYFFLAYVIVSMIISLSADKMLHDRVK